VCFRYFNAGADNWVTRKDHNPETHLIPLVLMTALGKREYVSIFGTDYPARRNLYSGLYSRHRLGRCSYIGSEISVAGWRRSDFNLENGNGFSVKQVIDTAKTITGRILRWWRAIADR